LLLFQNADKPFSGPQPGEPLPPFRVLLVNTTEAGREIDFVCAHKSAPMLIVFLHQLDRNVAALIQPIERYSQDRSQAGLKTLYVYLCQDKVEGERRMVAVAKSLRLQSAVGVSVDGVEGPGSYGLNKQVAVTALVADSGKVTANFAISQPGMVDAPGIIGEVARLAGGRPPTLAELQAEREKSMAAANMQRMQSQAVEPDPPELISLLRRLIRRDNTQDQVNDAVERLKQWAGTDMKRRGLVAKKMEIIIPLRYGTEYAQSQMPLLKVAMER
jgi:hypothetical protein